MIDIDDTRFGIIQSQEMGNVAWKWKTFSQRRDDRD